MCRRSVGPAHQTGDIADKLDPGNFRRLSNGTAAALQARARERLDLLDALIRRADNAPQDQYS